MNKFYRITSKTFSELDVASTKELWDKVKEEYQGLSVNVNAEYKKSDDNKFHVTFSTDSEDRHMERVYQNFDLKHFKKNPVLLDSHNYSSIEHIIGRVEKPKVKDGKLEGDVVFALNNPKGLLAFHLAGEGFLNATSIGFIPKDFDNDGDITKSELLEISVVAVPANPEALFEKIVKEITTPPEENEAGESENEEIEENGSVEPSGDSPTPPEGGDIPEEGDEIEEKEATQGVGEGLNDRIRRMRADQVEVLARVAEGLVTANPNEKKRKIYKTLRQAFKSR